MNRSPTRAPFAVFRRASTYTTWAPAPQERDTNSLREIRGSLVQSPDESALAEAIVSLLADPASLAQVPAAAGRMADD